MKILLKEKNSYSRLLAMRLAMDLKAEVYFEEDSGADHCKPGDDHCKPGDAGGRQYDFVLAEEGTDSFAAEEKQMPAALYYSKLAPASFLIQRIRSIWLSAESDLQELPVFTVTSACGGQGTTTAALELCEILAYKNKKVLFLSFDPFQSPTDKCIYELLADKEGSGAELLYIPVECRNYENSRPMTASVSISQLNGAEMKTLLRSVRRHCKADFLVIDVPFSSPHWSLCTMIAEELYIVKKVYEHPFSGLGEQEQKFTCLQQHIHIVTGGLEHIHVITNQHSEFGFQYYEEVRTQLESTMV